MYPEELKDRAIELYMEGNSKKQQTERFFDNIFAAF